MHKLMLLITSLIITPSISASQKSNSEHIIPFSQYVNAAVIELNKAIQSNDSGYFQEVMGELSQVERNMVFTHHQNIEEFSQRLSVKAAS